MSDLDGDISNVNPSLLELSKDPNAWREQRRKAMREKIFAQNSSHAGAGGASYIPLDSSPGVGAQSGPPPAEASRDETEAYVLQQIMSHKRKRDDAAAAESQPDPLAQAPAQPLQGQMSMKEKLLQKYKK